MHPRGHLEDADIPFFNKTRVPTKAMGKVGPSHFPFAARCVNILNSTLTNNLYAIVATFATDRDDLFLNGLNQDRVKLILALTSKNDPALTRKYHSDHHLQGIAV